MQMSGDASATGLADIQSKVEAVGAIKLFQRAFRALGQIDQFMSGFSGQLRQPVQMRVWHHHDVAGGIWKSIEADKTMLSTEDQATRGFGHFRHQFAYNVHIPRAQEILGAERTVHTAEHLASAIFNLGASIEEIPRARLGLAEQPPAAARPYAVLHPVATAPEKTWRADGFLEVARHIEESGLEAVFIGAAGDDLRLFSQHRLVQGAPLAQVKTLLAGASLFVGNDSGPAHMAAAFGVPSVVIFGASDPAIWGPWRTAAEVVTAPGGIAQVQIDQVLSALERLKAAA